MSPTRHSGKALRLGRLLRPAIAGAATLFSVALISTGAGAALGPIEIVSVNSDGVAANSAGNYLLDVSDDARFVLFTSSATNLIPSDDQLQDVFLRDRSSGTTERIVADAGSAVMSGDARFVLYAPNSLVGLWLLDRDTATAVEVTSVRSFAWAISGDGSTVAFVTGERLLPSDNDAMDDVYIYERETGALALPVVSMNPATPYYGGGGPVAINGDGSVIAFVTHVPLTTTDDCCTWDVFAHDLTTGTTVRVSATPSGGSGSSSGPVTISADGRTVAFVGGSLLPGTAHYGLYTFDLATSSLEYVSGLVVGGLTLSGDGRFLGYQYALTGLLMLHDRAGGTTQEINIQSDGSPGFNSGAVVVSADGSRVAFASMGTFVPSAPFGYQVYTRSTDKPDITPPAISVPADLTADATGPAGANVTYTVTATDENPANPTVTCTPPSGSVFNIGDTQVVCSATDAAGNTATASFTVHVKGAPEQVADLIALVDSYNLRLLGTALRDKLVKVQEFLAANKPKRACEKLDSFLAQVKEQRGKRISVEQADRLTTDARRIKAVIGC